MVVVSCVLDWRDEMRNRYILNFTTFSRFRYHHFLQSFSNKRAKADEGKVKQVIPIAYNRINYHGISKCHGCGSRPGH
jgi:hypothetical protein